MADTTPEPVQDMAPRLEIDPTTVSVMSVAFGKACKQVAAASDSHFACLTLTLLSTESVQSLELGCGACCRGAHL